MFAGVQLTTLANGTRVVSSSIPHVQSVAMGIWVGVGSRHESRSLGGASHFLEHLLFKGTPKRSALAITQVVEGRGGYLNAFTQQDSTCYYARAGFDRLDPTFDVLADMVLNASCHENDVEKERQVILEEMLMYRDQAHHYVQELLEGIMWPSYSIGRPIIGTEKTVSALSAADLRRFKADKYVAPALVFAFSGCVDHQRCVAMVSDYFGTLPHSRRPRTATFKSSSPQIQATCLARDVEQTHMALGIRLFGRHDKNKHILRVLNTVLGENMSSRLFQVVREKHGLAYSIHSGVQLFADTGVLQIHAGLDRRRRDQAIALVLRELDRLRRRPIGVGELRRAKDYLVGQLRLGLESSSNQMIWLGENMLSYQRFVNPGETIEAIQNVTAADCQQLATELFLPKRMSLALITPIGDPMQAEAASAMLSAF